VENAGWALLLGVLATIALPIGAIVGMATKPSHRFSGALAGFGAGALFAALAIELIAPSMLNENASLHERATLLIGCAIGGLIFVFLDGLLNAKGGYLRKTATSILYFAHRREKQLKLLMSNLARSEFFRSIPPNHMHLLVDRLREINISKAEVLVHQGEEGDRLFILEEGRIDILHDNVLVRTLGPGDILGEIALISGAPRTADAVAKSPCRLLELSKRDFDRVCKQAPEIANAVKDLAARRLDELGTIPDSDETDNLSLWAAVAAKALRQGHRVPTPHELRKDAEEKSGAPMAIWLGALMDGVPESFVLGATFLAALTASGSASVGNPMSAVPMTLLAGLFLSNFPEAMSSSVGMANQGWSKSKILLLWGSLTVVTSLLTMGGFLVGADVPEFVNIGLEGLAAGAMLTMIAQTMIPEAVHLSSPSVVGLSTLSGFLAAVGFKLLEG